jgi:hypothetical protein
MKKIAWTNTHYGRGCPIRGRVALDRVRAAYRAIGGSVRLTQDEDAAFVTADCREGDTISTDDNEEYELDHISEEAADNEAEAVRLWWNEYGWVASDEDGSIYCGGHGPDDIGGFRRPGQ